MGINSPAYRGDGEGLAAGTEGKTDGQFQAGNRHGRTMNNTINRTVIQTKMQLFQYRYRTIQVEVFFTVRTVLKPVFVFI